MLLKSRDLGLEKLGLEKLGLEKLGLEKLGLEKLGLEKLGLELLNFEIYFCKAPNEVFNLRSLSLSEYRAIRLVQLGQ